MNPKGSRRPPVSRRLTLSRPNADRLWGEMWGSGQSVGLHMFWGKIRPMKRGMQRPVDRQGITLGPGRHSDGGGLYLIFGPSGARRWAFTWTKENRRR